MFFLNVSSAIRSFLFYLFASVTICIGVPGIFLLSGLPFKHRFKIIHFWSKCMRFGMRWICGIRLEVTRSDGMLTEPVVIFARHESALETLVLSALFPMNCFVVKKALLYIPVFGWAFRASKHIPINRSQAMRSMMAVIKAGKSRIEEGISIVVFPEGTRMAPEAFRPFHKGAASIAKSMGVDVVPVVHNAGSCWKRNGFIKYPGVVKLIIGAPLPIKGLSVDEINQKVYDWMQENYPRNSITDKK
jgi:1-acyl-sn-glycerol-3-phosphate acyltransferase